MRFDCMAVPLKAAHGQFCDAMHSKRPAIKTHFDRKHHFISGQKVSLQVEFDGERSIQTAVGRQTGDCALGSYDGLSLFIKQRSESCRIAVPVKDIVHAGLCIDPNLDYIDGALLINFLKAIHRYPS